jgi:hypothetical protein
MKSGGAQQIFLSVGIALFLVYNAWSLAYSYVTEDSRFGFGMFVSNIRYTVEFYTVSSAGARTRLAPRELFYDDLAHRLGHGWHVTRYGEGEMRAWVEAYLAHVYAHTPNTQYVDAVVTWSKNRGPQIQENIRYPL